MTDTTERLALPMLQPGQSRKELFHNEALALLDLAVPAVVEAVGLEAPPASPAPGQAWALGPAPAGEWVGRAGAIAGCTASGWRFVAPIEGMVVWSRADGCAARWLGGSWTIGEERVRRVLVAGNQVLGPRRPAVVLPVGGAAADVEARSAISAIISALVAHGLVDSGV